MRPQRVSLAALASTLSLAGCGHLLQLPAIGASKPPPPPALASACPTGQLADLQPMPPVPADAGFPAAASQDESAAIGSYLNWLHALAAWGRAGWQRAGEAKGYCATLR